MKALHRILVTVAVALSAGSVLAHGDVTPQPVDVSTLPPLGAELRDSNPYRGTPAFQEAVRVGASAYNQNCARCHGLEAISGGIAPDLRKLDMDCMDLADAKAKAECRADVDSYMINTVKHGRARNGKVYMPPFEGVLQQEAIWAIKSYLETRASSLQQ